jgi:hypothetical protein
MIVERGGDYLLRSREPVSYESEKLFSIEEREGFITPGYTYARKVDDNHGRLEIGCWATSRQRFDYLRGRTTGNKYTLAMIRSERRMDIRRNQDTLFHL